MSVSGWVYLRSCSKELRYMSVSGQAYLRSHSKELRNDYVGQLNLNMSQKRKVNQTSPAESGTIVEAGVRVGVWGCNSAPLPVMTPLPLPTRTPASAIVFDSTVP